MTREEWAEEVKCELVRHHLKQWELADRLGYTRQYVSQVINGNVPHEARELTEKISEALGVEVPEMREDARERG